MCVACCLEDAFCVFPPANSYSAFKTHFRHLHPDHLAAPRSRPSLRGPTAPSPTEHFPPGLWPGFLYHCRPPRPPLRPGLAHSRCSIKAEYITRINTDAASLWARHGLEGRWGSFIRRERPGEARRGGVRLRQFIPPDQALKRPSLLASVKVSGGESAAFG